MDRRSPKLGRSPAFACWFNSSTEYLAQGSPPTWWFLGCVPFSNASGFTLVRFFCPIRDVYRARSSDSGPQRYGPLRPVCSSSSAGPRAAPPGPWCPGPPGWLTACQSPQHLSSSRQSPRLGGWWVACQGPGAPEPPAFGMGIPVRSGRSDRRAAGKGFLPSEMTALASR